MIWWFAFVFFVGVILGTITMGLLFSASVQDDVLEQTNRYLESEVFMQRLYYISEQVKYEEHRERLEEYRKILGCNRCNRKIPSKDI